MRYEKDRDGGYSDRKRMKKRMTSSEVEGKIKRGAGNYGNARVRVINRY